MIGSLGGPKKTNGFATNQKMFIEYLLKRFHNDEEDDTYTRFVHLYQKGEANEYTPEWEVLANKFHDLTNDQLMKMYISKLKTIIRSELRISRQNNLVETRTMA